MAAPATRARATGATGVAGLEVAVVLGLLLVQAGGSLLVGVMFGTHLLGAVNDDRYADAGDARLGAGLLVGGAVAWLVGCAGAQLLWPRRMWPRLAGAGAATLTAAAVVLLVTAPDVEPPPQPGNGPGIPLGMVFSVMFPHAWSPLLLGVVGALAATTSSARRGSPAAATPAIGGGALVVVTVGVAVAGLGRTSVLSPPLTPVTTAGYLTAVATTSLLLCLGLARQAGPGFARFGTAVVAVLAAGAGWALVVAAGRWAFPPGGPGVVTDRDGFGNGLRAGVLGPAAIPLTVAAVLSLIHLALTQARPGPRDERR